MHVRLESSNLSNMILPMKKGRVKSADKQQVVLMDEVLKDCVKRCSDPLEDSDTTHMSLSDDETEADLPRTKPLKVRFAEEPEVHIVITLRNQKALKSKNRAWFGPKDLKAFRTEIKDTVHKMEYEIDEKEETSLMGFETGNDRSKRRTHQLNSWDAVLYEQEDQCNQGISSPFRIARAYRSVSGEATFDAVLKAAALAKEVLEDARARR